ncbi:CynX/NimT family MFS transporter [Leifsonia sp. Root112D2]|uniref:CynX/NimT family MFS transporter n=1 Tax=Leifsonia sp. Root112D2 TaxID=1736426 RepID=UPI000700770A|nr:MFS transporter [Leifsonia sp. Root112D2]KQV08334.1 MFS transporter [Leifsonia sp. Root112D2]
MSDRRGPGSARTEVVARSGLLLVGILLIGANLRASITAVGPVLGEIQADVGISGVAASVLISIPLIGFAAVSPIAPAIARRFGIERTLAAALLLLSIAIVVRSLPLAGAIWVGTVALGAAIALINVLLPSLIKRDYPDRVGPTTGLYSAVQSAAAAVAAGIAVPISGIAQEGWRLSLGIWAGLAVVGLAVFLPQLRRRAETRAGGAREPADEPARQAAVGAPDEPIVPGAVAVPGELGRHPTLSRSPWGTALGWQVTIFMGLQSTVYYTIITWWPTIERQQGTSAAAAGWHQFAFQAVSILGSVSAAALLHRLRDQRMLIATLASFILVAMIGQLFLPALALLWMMMAGVAGGGSIVVALSLFGLRTRNHVQAAALSGMAQSVGYLLAAAGPIVIGLLRDITGSWTASLLVLIAVILGQLVMGVLAGRARFLPGR